MKFIIWLALLITMMVPVWADYWDGLVAYKVFRDARYASSSAVLDAATEIDATASGLSGNYVIDGDRAKAVLERSIISHLGLQSDLTSPIIGGPIQIHSKVVNTTPTETPLVENIAGVEFCTDKSAVMCVIEFTWNFRNGNVETFLVPAMSNARIKAEVEG